MTGLAYKLLGFVVWNGGRWYLSQRITLRRGVFKATFTLSVFVGGAVLGRRLSAHAPRA